MYQKIDQLRDSISQVIVGQTKATELLLSAIIADGHVLLEGVPGIAKTLTARYMAKLLGANYGRIQFTPDLMPSDVLGTEIFEPQSGTFRFHPGPVFAQMVLADEINRAPAKTQSALFEVMEERQVTVSGKSYQLSPLFTIIATQNPIEQEGTYRLPEAQLDRFICKIAMGYPSVDEEVEILLRHHNNAHYTKLNDMEPVMSPDDILAIRSYMHQVTMDTSLMKYIANITALSRQSQYISLPASPRAAISIMRMAKANALINHRNFVTPDDVRYVTPAVLAHRIQLSTDAELEGINPSTEIERLLSNASTEIAPEKYS